LNLIEVILAQGSMAQNRVNSQLSRKVRAQPSCYDELKDVMATLTYKKFKKNKINIDIADVSIDFKAIFLIANLSILSINTFAQNVDKGVEKTTTNLKPVVVTGTASERSGSTISDLSDAPLARTPISANVLTAEQIQSAGAKRLADLTKFDASVSDAYNTAGYWDYATVRGFVINNKYNYRREGLPISAETFIALDNKESVEILKGTSGIQAGTSSPGGLVNYNVKRPTQNDLRSVRFETTSYGSILGAVDLGGRAGENKEFGYRVNAAAETVDNYTPASAGSRQLLAIATDWRINKDSILEAEFEYSRRSQPSVPGLSLAGKTLPSPNAKLNINNQSWSQPVVLEGLTGTVKFEQAINSKWRWFAQAGTQQLTSQDRVAFPFGCTDGKTYYANTYCPNGNFDLYDFRSDNENRKTTSAKLEIKGQMDTPLSKINPTLGILTTSVKDSFEKQAYNYSGTGNLNSLASLPAAAALTGENTNRDERSTELYFNNSHNWTADFTTWTGVRYTRLTRHSVRTDGSRATDYNQNLNTRFVAASYQINPAHMAYASFGQGVESEVTPGRSRYTNAGEALPALTSKQFEIGIKGELEQLRWSAAWFDTTRPMFGDLGSCSKTASCTRQVDGTAKHRGLELTASTAAASAAQPWHVDGGITVINAKRQGSTIDASQNGLRPTNVPEWVLRLNTTYKVAAIPGLQLNGHLSHEGKRAVLPDNSVNIPAWTRLDLGASYNTKIANTQTTWSFGVDNVMNKSYFKESPYQFSHAYLFPGAPRTARLSVQIAL
jgi:iron complex outermembrane recepter protein